MTTTNQDMELFFIDPVVEPGSPPHSVLHLLRRSIAYCIAKQKTLWLATMGIFAGTDLLAKFYEGNDDYRESKKYFKRFVHEYFQPISADDEQTIYQLRNALMHSFGLYSRRRNRVYRFALTRAPLASLVNRPQGSPDRYIISIQALYLRFEEAVGRYHADVRDSADLQEKFDPMFRRYGTIATGTLEVELGDS